MKSSSPISNENKSVFGIVSKALDDHGRKYAIQDRTRQHKSTSIFEDDDPAKKMEAEHLMDYMDSFNDLINAKEFSKAAKHAANSPKGILRTADVMKIFKENEKETTEESPWMMFCEALMATAKSAAVLSGAVSVDVIRCALRYKRMDLVAYWLAQNCFSLTVPMANVLHEHCRCEHICKCGAKRFAVEIYDKLGCYRQVAACLIGTGQYHRLLQYSQSHNFTVGDCKVLLKMHNSDKLLKLFINAHPADDIPCTISFACAINILLESNNNKLIVALMKTVFKNGVLLNDGSKASLLQLLLLETFNDNMSKEKWLRVVQSCEEASLHQIAEELLCCLVTRDALDNASYRCVLDYIS